jgi:hypothetical protein
MGKIKFHFMSAEEVVRRKSDPASMSMDMASLIDEMGLPPPSSPDPEHGTALDEPPQVLPQRVEKKRPRAVRCLDKDFARPPSRSPSPPPVMSPPALLSPRRVTLRTSFGDEPLVQQEAGKDKAGAAAAAADDAAAADERPSKALRMQVRQKKKAVILGGSSAHNAAPLQRMPSMYVPCPVEGLEEKDGDMLLAMQKELKEFKREDSPLPAFNLEIDFEFEQFHMSDLE